MKAVILAGGLGTRMREETEFKPKPMVEVGGKPVLWHLMKLLSFQGISEFVVCTGYKGDYIKRYFHDFATMNQDFTVGIGPEASMGYHGSREELDWKVTVADTGLDTLTGGRLLAVRKYLNEERFLLTYGDGLADVDLGALLERHEAGKKTLTITTTMPRSRFGVVELDELGNVLRFLEKPIGGDLVNIGFMISQPEIFDYIHEDSPLEEGPFRLLAEKSQLAAYRHDGFWQPMDTIREAGILNSLWSSGQAPWAVWEKNDREL
jgi:glucose-1-phosphate cytidylyltransferase